MTSFPKQISWYVQIVHILNSSQFKVIILVLLGPIDLHVSRPYILYQYDKYIDLSLTTLRGRASSKVGPILSMYFHIPRYGQIGPTTIRKETASGCT